MTLCQHIKTISCNAIKTILEMDQHTKEWMHTFYMHLVTVTMTTATHFTTYLVAISHYSNDNSQVLSFL